MLIEKGSEQESKLYRRGQRAPAGEKGYDGCQPKMAWEPECRYVGIPGCARQRAE